MALRHFGRKVLFQVPGFKFIGKRMARLEQGLDGVRREMDQRESNRASLQVLEYRIDLIYKNLVERLEVLDHDLAGSGTVKAPTPGGAYRFKTESFKRQLAHEAEALHVAGSFDPAKCALRLDPRTDQDRWYLATHMRRFEQTFAMLRRYLPEQGRGLRMLDAGTNPIYHPELHRRLPEAEMHFVGRRPEGHPRRWEVEGWRDADLESDRLAFEDGSLDAVCLFEVLEHFFRDPMACLAEVNRVLKPGGLFLLTTPNVVSWKALTAVLHGYSPMTYGKFTRAFAGANHAREYAPREVALLLECAGFSPTVWTESCYHEAEGTAALGFLAQNGFDTAYRGDTTFAVGTKQGPVVRRLPIELYDCEGAS